LIGSSLPWWVVSVSGSGLGVYFSADASVYLYRVYVSAIGQAQSLTAPWYALGALVLLLVGAILAFAGSVAGSKRRIILALSGILALGSILLFVSVFQTDIAHALSSANAEIPAGLSFGLFSGGTVGYEGLGSLYYSCYLSYGIWVALVGAIIILAAAARKTPPSADTTPLSNYS